MTSDPLLRIIPMDEKGTQELLSNDTLLRMESLEDQLAQFTEKMRVRETVIVQLEEEIRAKEELIHEQKHLIEVLEAVHNNQINEKADGESICSDSEITIIEKIGVASSSKSDKSDSPTSSVFDDIDRMREILERTMIDREKLELQNEQLLRQWEEALEYVSKVQKQLQDEISRNSDLKEHSLDMQKRHQDMVCISREFVQFLVVLLAVVGFYLYML